MIDAILNIATLIVVLMLGGAIFVGVMMWFVGAIGLLDD
jgi:hypothetical protein